MLSGSYPVDIRSKCVSFKPVISPKILRFLVRRRSKGANAVFGGSRRLMTETELSGLCDDEVGAD